MTGLAGQPSNKGNIRLQALQSNRIMYSNIYYVNLTSVILHLLVEFPQLQYIDLSDFVQIVKASL